MKASVKVFHQGIIDYAGLFPPAALALNPALAQFSSHRSDSAAFLLARFVIPSEKLPLVTFGDNTLLSQHAPYRFSVLVGGGVGREGFSKKVDSEFAAISRTVEEHRGNIIVDALELKISPNLVPFSKRDGVYDFVSNLADKICSNPFCAEQKNLVVYFELTDVGKDFKSCTTVLVKGLAKHNELVQTTGASYSGAGLKVRTGGVNIEDVPSVERVCFSVLACRDNFISFKATAGLHHPVRHRAKEPATEVHGFFNVFGGGILAHARSLSFTELEGIVSDKEKSNFQFEENKFSWKRISVSVDEIKNARGKLMHSFGSCSFIEPKEDLQRLDLL